MAVPSLEELLAELDNQELLECDKEASQPSQEEPAVKASQPSQDEPAVKAAEVPELQEQVGGSSSSTGRKRRGGRFSQMCTAGTQGQAESQPPAADALERGHVDCLRSHAVEKDTETQELRSDLKKDATAEFRQDAQEGPNNGSRSHRDAKECLDGKNGNDTHAEARVESQPCREKGSYFDFGCLDGADGNDTHAGVVVDSRSCAENGTSEAPCRDVLAVPEQQPELPDLRDLLSQLDSDANDMERQRAKEEAAAFEERQRRARQEALDREKEERRRLIEAAMEERERQAMAAEEAEERRRRANRYANVLEEKTRCQAVKQSAKRRKEKEEALKQQQLDKERRKEERLRSEAAKMSEQIRRMAENGYALGPNGWVRLDWLSPGDAPEFEQPNFKVGPKAAEEEEDEPDEGLVKEADVDTPFEVVDQRPLPESEQLQLDVVKATPIDEVLADLDKRQLESWASGAAEAPDLDTVLGVVDADEEREQASTAASAIRQSFQELGQVEEVKEDEIPDATESATNILNAAKSRRPDANFSRAIKAESALKPWNDFVEEKQEGSNSYEERKARSAAIQAKLQAARNRLSVVRYERNGASAGGASTGSASAGGASAKCASAATPEYSPPPRQTQQQLPQTQFKLSSARDEPEEQGQQAGWGWLGAQR